MSRITVQITVTGLVQGVGFRPFIYRMALKQGLTGWVQNTNENVRICVSGEAGAIDHFVTSIREEAPPAAMIDSVETNRVADEEFASFEIHGSHNVSGNITEISPDIAVCPDCLEDIKTGGNRPGYSFVNCTNCGPRFTIIRDLPYDRAKTTMSVFPMCPACKSEYETITDRRFHAQPTACADCGPHYELFVAGKAVAADIPEILDLVARILDQGGIVAMKGLGGMHLACDAFNPSAVQRLRDLKNREAKPFAVMFSDLQSIKDYTLAASAEEQSLLSWRRPIVLLEMKDKIAVNLPLPAQNINAGLNLLGIMLPYLPFHYQLFRKLQTRALVLTSGNFSSEPILTDNKKALIAFASCTDAVLLHNRDIFNRTDDSVARVMVGKERIFRRSRGYVPAPVRLNLNCEGIISFGAELSNCFAVGKGRKAYLSQHIGDLKGLETTEFYAQTLQQFISLFRVTPGLLAVDLHPDYISTRKAEEFMPLPLLAVQHHHAHIASCMAEHGLDERVIGVAFDGTGFGEDGNIWGAEFFCCDLAGYTRESHFDYIPLPGGDLANEEPWRMALSYLYRVYGKDFLNLNLPFLEQLEMEKIEMILRMIERNVNCPLTSSAGRLFDAVASILGVCQLAAFPAQGPMLLESLAFSGEANGRENREGNYAFDTGTTINFEDTIRGIVRDVAESENPSIICRKFHNTIILAIFETVKAIRHKEGINKVVLSGGVFQNKYLLEGTALLLGRNNFEVYIHSAVPSNDGGIALGQMAIAAKRRELKCV